jgi:hypothetical protein
MRVDEQDSLNRIRKGAAGLSAAADKATAYVRSLNDQLKEVGVGLTVEGPVFRTLEETNRKQTTECVAYADTGRAWELAYIRETYEHQKDLNTGNPTFNCTERLVRSLVNADRETRLLAVPHIPALLGQIADAMQEATSRVASVVEPWRLQVARPSTSARPAR